MAIRRRSQGYDVAVIGGGVAGLTAAWHAAQHGLSVALFEGGMLFGGQVANVDRVEGFPAAADLSGPALASALVDHLQGQGVGILEDEVRSIALGGLAKQVTTESGMHRAKTVVVASGARLRTLGVPGEQEMLGRGVSQCTTCDGPLFRGQDVAVIGGGDAALQGAIALSAFCRSVGVVVRGALRARRSYVDRASAAGNLHFVWDSTVTAIRGGPVVEGLTLAGVKDGATRELPCGGVFVLIGSDPDTGFLPPDVVRSGTGHLVTDDALACSVQGLYAVGAVRQGYAGDLVTAAGEAAAAVCRIAAAQG